MTELLNKKELAAIIAKSPVTDGHEELLTALHIRYPGTEFRLISEWAGRTWDAGIIDAVGNRITDSLATWINQELIAAGGDAREVWNRHKESGLIRTEREGSVLYLTAPFGADPDMFHQLEIEVGPEVATQRLFDPKAMFPPEDRHDLLSGPSLVFGESERQILAPPCYHLDQLVNVRRFLRELVEVEKANRLAELPEMEKKIVHVHDIYLGPDGGQTSRDVPVLEMCPGWLDWLPPAFRLFQDWQESSAGRGGYLFCDHWWAQTNKWTDHEGRRRLSIIPQWVEADGGLNLPKISLDWEDSPYGVIEMLLQFDRQAGYPFAWFFYMVHGNRISHSAGSVVAKAIKEGRLRLPPCDEAVLLRWDERQYGF